ncbi:MAG: glycosyltransferase family 2 protein [Gammaproteobacteria bacterium]|nr:glycosyltransferase family 2 protein [Gammaproteobacteria bacterium]
MGDHTLRMSVILITKNEAAMIGRALQSVAWADEIIVVDSGSTDNTVEICRQAGAKVLVTADWPGFGPQKNRALALATGDWVLSLDADEWVTTEAQREIRHALAHAGSTQGFRLPRRSSYCGHFMRHGGWWPDHVLRLFRREQGRFSDDLVHERLMVDGPIGTLQAPLLHETYRDLDEVLDKVNAYSAAGARMAFAAGRRTSLGGAVARGAWAFFRTYILRLGLLDGPAGFMLAVSNAETVYYKYRKLALLCRAGGPKP